MIYFIILFIRERGELMFSVDPKVYSSMFSLPSVIAERELKLASGDQLKVIICIFKNPGADISDIAKKTNLTVQQTEECVEYWIGEGILQSDFSAAANTENQAPRGETPKTPLPEIHYVNPTQEEIAKILKSSSSMKRLFNEAQEILGRTLGYTMQCAIYAVVNFYGITPDVANCLLHFAKSIGCTSQNDIQKIARYWAENGVTTLSVADEYINETEKAYELYRELASRTGNSEEPASFAVLEMICEWIRWGYGADEVVKAFEIMKAEKQTGRLKFNNFRHMNGTIKNWRAAGMITVEDIEKGTAAFGGKKKKENKETSFDVELAEKTAREKPKSFGSAKNKKHKDRKGA